MPWWSKNPCWDDSYDGESEPKDSKQEGTRNGETVADALTGKDQGSWNKGTYGDYDCDHDSATTKKANAVGDTERYYDQCNSADIQITIKKRKN